MDSFPAQRMKDKQQAQPGGTGPELTGFVSEQVTVILPTEGSEYFLILERDVRSRRGVLLVQTGVEGMRSCAASPDRFSKPTAS